MSKKKDEQNSANRVHRGGGWFNSPAYARVALRYGYVPGFRGASLGVRLVRRLSALERLAESLREVSDGKG
jgi:formylglycine-generating enzyme required for sulfatase activity